MSAEVAYLTPEVLARPNLKVVTLARVTRIIFDSSSGTPRAVAVDFANEERHAPRFRVRARKEVIVWYVPRMSRLAIPQCSVAAEQFTLPKSSCSPVSVLHLYSRNTTSPFSLIPPAWALISATTLRSPCGSKTSSAFLSTTRNHTT